MTVFRDMALREPLFAALDPNWLYSTMAQSAAALVGLLGGFFVQRLFVLRAELTPHRQKARNAAIGGIQDIDGYRQRLLDLSDALENRMVIGNHRSTENPGNVILLAPGEVGAGRQFRLLIPPNTDGPTNPKEKLNSVAGRLREAAGTLPQSLREVVEIADGSREWPQRPAWMASTSEPSSAERIDFWNHLALQEACCKEHFDKLERLHGVGSGVRQLKSMIPPYIRWLVVFLAALLVFGVFTPMLFLSGKGGVMQVLLLVLFAALLAGLVFALWYEASRLRRAAEVWREHL